MFSAIIQERFLKLYEQYHGGKGQAHISTASDILQTFPVQKPELPIRIVGFTLPSIFKLV